MRASHTFMALTVLSLVVSTALCVDSTPQAKTAKKTATPLPPWPTPELPNGQTVVTDTSDRFLQPIPNTLRDGVVIAKHPPTIDFLFPPGQTYRAKIWSNWGDSLAANGKYYSAIGDHNGPEGNAFVYEYDPAKKKIRTLVDMRELLRQPPQGTYTPGKIHSRIDLGKDGKLYFSTHRGSTTVTNSKYNYQGDWIVSVDPTTGKSDLVAHGPVPNHCLPASIVDPDRMIFYAGTAPGSKTDGDIHFLAYDLLNRKVLYAGPNGPARTMIFARSTGRVYFYPQHEDASLRRFDPADPKAPTPIAAKINMRACTEETAEGFVYCLANSKESGPYFASFNTKTETLEELGPAAVASMQYITSVDIDPTGRYIYYVPGAHSGAQRDGTPVVQFDVKKRQRKVIAFLSPFYKDKYKVDPVGTYATAIDPKGDTLYITWNADRGVARNWDCCAITAIHIPESERQP